MRSHTAADKLRVAQMDGYLSSDWQSLSSAQLLEKAESARNHVTHTDYARQWYLTQAEYLTEAAAYTGDRIDVV